MRQQVGNAALAVGVGSIFKSIFAKKAPAPPPQTGPGWHMILGMPAGTWDWESDSVIDAAYHERKQSAANIDDLILLSAARLEALTIYHQKLIASK